MVEPIWRAQLVPASFRGAQFKIEVNARGGGRRSVTHEFPKRDTPYGEDMGRRARRFPITGYVIGPDYTFYRNDLTEALELEGPGLLILPTLGEQQVLADQYSVRESRRQGGMAEFDMIFSEAGEAGFNLFEDTRGAAISAASALNGAVQTLLNEALGNL